MTTQEIFAANQVLTVSKAKELKGKKIFTTNPEDKSNKCLIEEFIVGNVISKWDNAANELMNDGKFKTRQDYWLSYMNAKQIDEMKTNFILLTDNGAKTFYVAHTKFFNFYEEPTFTGSDADREVYFLEA